MKDYTLRCDCGFEDTDKTESTAKKNAKNHLKVCRSTQASVFIDEYDSKAGDMGGGELTGNYWIIKK